MFAFLYTIDPSKKWNLECQRIYEVKLLLDDDSTSWLFGGVITERRSTVADELVQFRTDKGIKLVGLVDLFWTIKKWVHSKIK